MISFLFSLFTAISRHQAMILGGCLFCWVWGWLSGCSPAQQSDCSFDQTTLGIDAQLSANAGCIVVEDKRLLVIVSPSAEASIPGGGFSKSENAACTAIRETREETGLNVTPTALAGVWHNGFHMFDCAFAATSNDEAASAANATQISRPAEVQKILWLPASDFDQYVWRYPKQADWLREYIIDHHPQLDPRTIKNQSPKDSTARPAL